MKEKDQIKNYKVKKLKSILFILLIILYLQFEHSKNIKDKLL